MNEEAECSQLVLSGLNVEVSFDEAPAAWRLERGASHVKVVFSVSIIRGFYLFYL